MLVNLVRFQCGSWLLLARVGHCKVAPALDSRIPTILAGLQLMAGFITLNYTAASISCSSSCTSINTSADKQECCIPMTASVCHTAAGSFTDQARNQTVVGLRFRLNLNPRQTGAASASAILQPNSALTVAVGPMYNACHAVFLE
jgi:hypothetical protein